MTLFNEYECSCSCRAAGKTACPVLQKPVAVPAQPSHQGGIAVWAGHYLACSRSAVVLA